MQLDIIKKKILLLGDASVGKTSLIRRFVLDQFDDRYITTIGVKVTKKEMEVEKDGGGTQKLGLIIWDMVGQKGFKGLLTSNFKNAAGAILVCDLTRKDTLESIESYWHPAVLRESGEIPTIIMANKVDLVGQRAYGEDDVSVFADSIKAPRLLTSAKTGENVEKGFRTLGKIVV